MKKVALALAMLLVSATCSLAANVNIDGLPAAPSVTGSDLYECEQSGVNRRCTPAQLSTYIQSVLSGDCAIAANVITCTKTVGALFASSATVDTTNATNIASGTLAKARLPSPFATATLSGNTSVLGTVSGAITIGDCLKFDASNNLTDAGAPCGGGGGGSPPGGSNTQLQYNNAGAFGGITGATSNGTSVTLTSPTFTAPVLGTPASGTLTLATGLPISTGVSGLGTGVATFLGTPSSANLASALTDETGSGKAVFDTQATITGPTINTAATLAFVTGSTQCLQVNTSGQISGTAAPCGGAGSVGGNPTATAGDVAVNGVASTFLRSDGAPAIQKSSASVFGIAKVDGSTITASGGVITAVGVAVLGGNPTATASDVAVNGVATTYLRSDGAPAIQKASSSQFGIAKVDNTTVVANAGVLSFNATLNTQAGTTYTVVSGDRGKIVQFTNAAAVAVTIPVASAGGFGSTFYTTFQCLGVAGCTLTPTTSTIDGGASLVLGQFQSVDVTTDGVNYTTLRGRSNGANTASPNTWTAAQTFGSVIGTVTTQSGTTYTLASADCGTTVRFSNASAVTVTIPQGLPIGCSLAIEQAGAGAVAVNGAAVTPAILHSAHGYTKTSGQWAVIGVFTESTNVAVVTGDGV